MKKVLIITYYWPPTSGSGVQRWLKMSKYLPENGWQPIIYTPANPDMQLRDETLCKDIPEGIEVIRRPIVEPYSLFRIITGRKRGGSEGGNVNPIGSSGKKSVAMRLSLWIRANIFVPDPRVWWVRPSVRFLRRYLAENRVDAVVSTGPPHSMHMIAMKLHRATEIRWIADFRDPWTKIFYFKHLPLTKRNARRYGDLEREVLKEADAVVTVTAKMTAEFMETLGECNADTPVITVENGYDEDDFRNGDIPASESFTLVHTGLFSSEGNPAGFWKVLGEISDSLPSFGTDLRIEIAGKTDREITEAIVSAGIGSRLVNHGYIPHHQANSLQRQARVLLLPLRQEPEADGILTGKYFEYLAAGRPIIAFGPHNSVLEESLRETGAGMLFDWEETAGMKLYIATLYRHYLESRKKDVSDCDMLIREILAEMPEGRMPDYPEPDRDAVSRYSRRKLAGKFAGILSGQ